MSATKLDGVLPRAWDGSDLSGEGSDGPGSCGWTSLRPQMLERTNRRGATPNPWRPEPGSGLGQFCAPTWQRWRKRGDKDWRGGGTGAGAASQASRDPSSQLILKSKRMSPPWPLTQWDVTQAATCHQTSTRQTSALKASFPRGLAPGLTELP